MIRIYYLELLYALEGTLCCWSRHAFVNAFTITTATTTIIIITIIIIIILPQFTTGHRPLKSLAISLDLWLLASDVCEKFKKIAVTVRCIDGFPLSSSSAIRRPLLSTDLPQGSPRRPVSHPAFSYDLLVGGLPTVRCPVRGRHCKTQWPSVRLLMCPTHCHFS
jgi:hypothetical protein